MTFDDFNDPAETRHLLERMSSGGALAVPVDCALASPRTFPAISELVRHGFITFRQRTTMIVDCYTLTPAGAAMLRAAGVPCAEPEATMPAEPVSERLN